MPFLQPLKKSDFWLTPEHCYPKDCFDPCPVNPTFDGLSISWHGEVFCNPPYSQIIFWVKKALQEKENPNVVSITMLLPNWTDREWFHMLTQFPMTFTRGRLKFLDPKTGLSPYQPRFGSVFVKIK